MWQRLQETWFPWTLFAMANFAAAILLALVFALPFVVDGLPFSNSVLHLFVSDATVRRSSIAGAIGLVVTAFVFFRPSPAPTSRKKKPAQDTVAGA
jgi:hypothetical protein